MGMNFSIALNRIPTSDIIAAIEATAQWLDPTMTEQLRAGVNRVLHCARPPKPNLSHRQAALKNLRDDLNVVIIPADKGNATVVIDRAMYEDKMNNIVNDEPTYMKLKRDPMHDAGGEKGGRDCETTTPGWAHLKPTQG